jgi:hypothetical protein
MCQQRAAQPAELEAFCPTCPLPQEVSALLATLGFTLAFHMDAVQSSYAKVPALPAQYHFKKDGCGTEVIYLAGRDTPLEEGEVFPFHASRFWLYAGADAQAFQLTLSTLALRYGFAWRDPSEQDTQQEEVA